MESPNFEVELEEYNEVNMGPDDEANFSVDMDWDDISDNDDIDSIKFDISLDSCDDWNTDDIDSIKFDTSLDSCDDWNTDDIDDINFDFSIDDLEYCNTDGSMNFEESQCISGDSYEQEGAGNRFAIEQIRERRIVKFNVQGYEYRVRVDSFQREMSFDQAVITLHGVLRGKKKLYYIYIYIYIYILF